MTMVLRNGPVLVRRLTVDLCRLSAGRCRTA